MNPAMSAKPEKFPQGRQDQHVRCLNKKSMRFRSPYYNKARNLHTSIVKLACCSGANVVSWYRGKRCYLSKYFIESDR